MSGRSFDEPRDTRLEGETIASLFRRLLRAPKHAFPKSNEKLEAPEQLGVYIIYDRKDRVLHVGSTPRAKKGIAQRLRDHLCNRSSFTTNFLSGDGERLRHGCKFRYLEVEVGRNRALLEALTIGRLCPAHIGHGRDGETSN